MYETLNYVAKVWHQSGVYLEIRGSLQKVQNSEVALQLISAFHHFFFLLIKFITENYFPNERAAPAVSQHQRILSTFS